MLPSHAMPFLSPTLVQEVAGGGKSRCPFVTFSSSSAVLLLLVLYQYIEKNTILKKYVRLWILKKILLKLHVNIH